MMSGKISPERFVELIEQIPVMQKKLDRILVTIGEIKKNGATGLNRKFDGETAFDFDPSRVAADKKLQDKVRKKREESQKLANEADELERELEV